MDSVRSNCNSKKSIMWFIMIPPAKFQTPNPSITASKCIPRFWSFVRFVWKLKKVPNFFIFEKLFTFLFWTSWFGYLKVRQVEFSSKLFLVWMKIEFLRNFSRFCMENSLDREFRWIRLKSQFTKNTTNQRQKMWFLNWSIYVDPDTQIERPILR